MSEEQNVIEEQVEVGVNEEELKEIFSEQFSRVRDRSMILGFRVCCKTVLDKIVAFERSPGSKSNNDHKRLIKDIKQLCETGISRKLNIDGKVETTTEETVRN